MSGLETGRYEYSNLNCESRGEGDEGSHNPYKMSVCLHFLRLPPSSPSRSQLLFCHKRPERMSQIMPRLDWGRRTCERE